MTYCPQTGKVCYPSESQAKQAHRKIGERLRRARTKRRRFESHPYHCDGCGLWHLQSNA